MKIPYYILNVKNKTLFIKYIIISIIGYSAIFLGLYILIDLYKVNKTLSFLIVYGITYVCLYFIQLKLLFKSSHSISKVLKFYAFILIFYILANMIFNIGLFLNFHYLISTAITVCLLMPIRFFVSKYYIFK